MIQNFNYLKGRFNVISFDSSKIRIVVTNNHVSVIKKTSIDEYNNYIFAQSLVSKTKKLKIMGDDFDIRLPNRIDWNELNNEIVTEYIDGINLELLLRNQEFHTIGVEFVNSILNFFIDIKFYWLDFAPRNIIISWIDKTIYLVDFEKGFIESNYSCEEYLILIIEEYSSFILPTENMHKDVFEKLCNKHNSIILNRYIINKSNRLRSLCKYLHFQTHEFEDSAQLYYWVIRAEVPYVSRQRIVFPIIKYEYLLHEFGYDFWAFYVGNPSIINTRGVVI